MEHNLKQMGNRIFIRRKELEITQKDFANRLNISNNHLSNIERGKSAPSFLLFLDICSELKTNTDYIASGALYADIDDEIIQKLKKCSDEHKIIISDIIDAFLKSGWLAKCIILSYNQSNGYTIFLFDFMGILCESQYVMI